MADVSRQANRNNIRYALVRTSIDDRETARHLAINAVRQHLATSVHIRQVESIYIWDNEECDHEEYEVEFMTIASSVDALCDYIEKEHPYDCAEIIKIGFQCLNMDFAAWMINGSTTPPLPEI